MALAVIVVAAVVIRQQDRAVIHLIAAATLPAVAPTVVMLGISTDFQLVERTLPVRLRRWDILLVSSVAVLTAMAISGLMRGSPWVASYAIAEMVVRALTFAGLLLCLAAVLSPQFAWSGTVVVLAATIRPFLQNPTLIEHPPQALFWWPTLPAETATILLAVGAAVLGAWLYTWEPRQHLRRWRIAFDED
jgi:hypothetical protein